MRISHYVLLFLLKLLGRRVDLALCLQLVFGAALAVGLELKGRRLVAKYFVLEVAEANHHDGHIVERAPQQRVLEDVLDAHAAQLVHVLSLSLDILMVLVVVGSLPDAHDHVTVGHLVEDAIATEDNKVMVLLDLERLDFGIVDHDVRIAAQFRYLGLRVSECPRDRQATWQDPQRTGERHLLHFVDLVLIVLHHLVLRGSVIDLATSCADSLRLAILARLVVETQRVHLLAALAREDCPRVADIGHVADFLDDQDDNGARAALVLQLLRLWVVNLVHECFLRLLKAPHNCLLRIRWEARLQDHVLVQVVPKEIGAKTATMAVVDAKVGAARPFVRGDICPRLRRQQICYYRYTVFIIVSNKSLIRIRRVSPHNTRALARRFGWIVVRNYYFVRRLDAEATLVMHVLGDLFHVAEAGGGGCSDRVPDVATVSFDVALTSGADANALRQSRRWQRCRLVRLHCCMRLSANIQT